MAPASEGALTLLQAAAGCTNGENGQSYQDPYSSIGALGKRRGLEIEELGYDPSRDLGIASVSTGL